MRLWDLWKQRRLEKRQKLEEQLQVHTQEIKRLKKEYRSLVREQKKEQEKMLHAFVQEAGFSEPRAVLRDLQAVPQRTIAIAGDFGGLIANLLNEAQARPDGSVQLHPESILPHPKETIEAALILMARTVSSEEIRKNAIGSLISLYVYFAPDEAVLQKPVLEREEFQNSMQAAIGKVRKIFLSESPK